MDNNWEDLLRLDNQLSEEERMIRDNVREYCNKSLMPRILNANRNKFQIPIKEIIVGEYLLFDIHY